MRCIVMWGLNHYKLLRITASTLQKWKHSLEMGCGCPFCWARKKKQPHIQSSQSHHMECMCQCTIIYITRQPHVFPVAECYHNVCDIMQSGQQSNRHTNASSHIWWSCGWTNNSSKTPWDPLQQNADPQTTCGNCSKKCKKGLSALKATAAKSIELHHLFLLYQMWCPVSLTMD